MEKVEWRELYRPGVVHGYVVVNNDDLVNIARELGKDVQKLSPEDVSNAVEFFAGQQIPMHVSGKVSWEE